MVKELDFTDRKILSEKDILLAKRRLNHGSPVLLGEEEYPITKAQTEKGIEFLRNVQWMKNGRIRKNAPFEEGSYEEEILRNFDHFTFLDFAECGKGWRPHYEPIYVVHDTKGNSFAYYYHAGKVTIVK